MPAVIAITSHALASRAVTSHQLAKRNWAGDNAGVVVVFCVVFIVAVAIIAVQVSKFLKRRKERRAALEAKA